MKTLIRTLAAALLAVLALPGTAHADDSRFDARALALSSESLLAEPVLGSPEVAELVAGEVYPAASEPVLGVNGWNFVAMAVGEATGYALEGTVTIIPAEDPVSEDLTSRALVTSGGPVHAYPHPDAAPVAQVGTGDTVYTDPSNVVEVSRFLSTETLIPAETTDGRIGWLPQDSVQVVGERGDEDDVPEPAEEPAEDETSEPTTEDPAADEATDEPGDDSPVPVDEEGDSETDGAGSEAFTVLGRGITDPLLLGGTAGVLFTVALGWAALRRRGGGRDDSVTGAVPVAPAPEPPEPEIEELVYDDGEDDVEELVYDAAAPTTPARASNEDPFEF